MRFRFPMLVAWLLIPEVRAQTHDWRNLGLSAGLLSEEVYDVHQDRSGHIWVFTELGIQRYDGRHFELLPGLPLEQAVAYAHAEDSAGGMWLGTSKGSIGYWKGGLHRTVLSSQAVCKALATPHLTIQQLLLSKSGNVYVQTDKGLLKVRKPAYNSLERVGPHPIPGYYQTLFMHQDSQAIAALVHPSGAHTLPLRFQLQFSGCEGLTYTLTLPANASMHAPRPKSIKTARGHYSLLFNQVHFEDGKCHRISVALADNGLQIREAPNGEVWVSTYHRGIYRFKADLKPLGHMLDGYSVTGMEFDSQGGIWASTLEAGLFHAPYGLVSQYNTGCPSGDQAISLLKPIDDSLLVGVAPNRLYSIARTGCRLLYQAPSPSAAVTDVAKLGPGLMVGTKNNTVYLTTLARTLTLPNGKVSNAYSLLRMGNRLLASSRQGLFWASPEGIRPIQQMPSLTRTLLEMDGRCFLATDQGVLEFTLTPGYRLLKTHLPDQKVNRLVKAMGGLYALTQGGLFRLGPGKQLPIILPAEVQFVTDLLSLPDSSLLLATRRGLVQGQLVKVNRFQPTRLLFDLPVARLAFWNGKIWLGTRKGVFSMPWPLPKPARIPLAIEAIKAGQEAQLIDLTKWIELRQKSLEVQIRAIELLPQPVYLRYRLAGPSPIQGTAPNQSLYFNDLSPGAYRLAITVVDAWGNALSDERQLAFRLLPEFWQTDWFLALCFMMAIGLVVGGWRGGRAYYRARDRKRSRLQQLLASYRITALQAQMNPHFVSNALTAIQQLILEGNTDRANDYLTRFSRLLRLVLEHSSQPLVLLNRELLMARLYLELEQLRFRDSFRFDIRLDDPALAEIMVPTLITQPFVENAVWHGLLPLSGERAPELLISVQGAGADLILQIEDNGVGRPAKKPIDQTQSHGIRLGQERLETLNAWLKADVQASIRIFDLKDDRGQPIGSRVTITLPNNLTADAFERIDRG